MYRVVQNNRFLVRLTSTLQTVDPKPVESTQAEQSRNKAGELQLAERALHRAKWNQLCIEPQLEPKLCELLNLNWLNVSPPLLHALATTVQTRYSKTNEECFIAQQSIENCCLSENDIPD